MLFNGHLLLFLLKASGVVKSMDNRVNAVLEAKGWYTR